MSVIEVTAGELQSVADFVEGLKELSQSHGVYLANASDAWLESYEGCRLGVSVSDYDRDAEMYMAVLES